MNKRLLWIVTLLLLAIGTFAEAQQPKKVPRIGYLSAATRPSMSARTEAFRQGLRELGYVEGKNIVIEWRFAEENPDRVLVLADLVRLKVDVIVTAGSGVTRLAKKATSTIPIVMAADFDPVRNGFVASLARPGGNIRIGYPSPRVERKTTGASEGDYSQALPCGLLREFDRIGQRTNGKRD